MDYHFEQGQSVVGVAVAVFVAMLYMEVWVGYFVHIPEAAYDRIVLVGRPQSNY